MDCCRQPVVAFRLRHPLRGRGGLLRSDDYVHLIVKAFGSLDGKRESPGCGYVQIQRDLTLI